MRKGIAIAAACAATVSVAAWATGNLPWQVAGKPGHPEVGTAPAAQAAHAVPDEAALRAATARVERIEARRRKQAALVAVGDADSFGRPLRWMGLMSMPAVQVREDCAAPDAPPVCLQTTNMSGYAEYRDVATVTLPGGSVHSMLCQWQSQTLGASFANYGTWARDHSLTVYPSVTVQSDVLAGLPLINPDTGQPMDGTLEVFTSPAKLSATLGPGETAVREQADTRTCVGGLLSRRNLRGYYGLSDAQVTEFFAAPVTLKLNVAVVASGVYGASVSLGMRFVGD